MKKLLLAITLCLATTTWSQWSYKTISNGFDEPFKKAYTETNNSGWLSMEAGYEETEVINPKDSTTQMITLPLLFLHGTYFCDEKLSVDIVFIVGGKEKKYWASALKSDNSTLIFFDSGIFADADFKSDFLAASQMKLRVNESHCESDIYTFKMSGSTSAYNFIMKN